MLKEKQLMPIVSLTAIYDQQIVPILPLANKTTTPSQYFLSLVHVIAIPVILERTWSFSSQCQKVVYIDIYFYRPQN